METCAWSAAALVVSWEPVCLMILATNLSEKEENDTAAAGQHSQGGALQTGKWLTAGPPITQQCDLRVRVKKSQPVLLPVETQTKGQAPNCVCAAPQLIACRVQ